MNLAPVAKTLASAASETSDDTQGMILSALARKLTSAGDSVPEQAERVIRVIDQFDELSHTLPALHALPKVQEARETLIDEMRGAGYIPIDDGAGTRLDPDFVLHCVAGVRRTNDPEQIDKIAEPVRMGWRVVSVENGATRYVQRPEQVIAFVERTQG